MEFIPKRFVTMTAYDDNIHSFIFSTRSFLSSGSTWLNRETAALFRCSTENGEKTEKAEPEPEVKEEEPEYKEEVPVKTKAKKEKKPAEEGFELWNELEIQRIKFMVGFILVQQLCD